MGGARARCPAIRDSKTQGKWTFTRARGELCANRPQVVQGTCAPTGAARLCPPDALRVIRGQSNGSGETRATALPKPSAAFSLKFTWRQTAPLPEHRFATRYRSGDMRSVSRLWRGVSSSSSRTLPLPNECGGLRHNAAVCGGRWRRFGDY